MAVDLETLDFDRIARAEQKKRKGSWIIMAGAFFVSAIWIVPFYYMAISIFKTTPEYAQNHPLALPNGLGPIVENAVSAWNNAKMGAGLFNSFVYGSIGAALAVFIAALAAYGLTRFDFRRRSLWFMLIFSGTVFPFQMYLIPLFFSYQELGLLNSHLGMLIFYTAICIPFPVLVLRNFMNGLSREMDEAARMDGAKEWVVFSRIVLPNCWGPMTATFLLQFTWIWNDLLFSTVLANKTNVRSIMSALQVFQGSYSATGPNVVMTAAIIASVPSIVLFIALRKHFMEGMRISNVG
ncbi:MAG: carbohydrate ABC transporter permease [Sulfitobacter sp.]